MDTVDTHQMPADTGDSQQSIRCGACESALQSPGRETISFLLLDQFTIPLVGCDTHLEQFRSVCSLTTENSVTLLDHHPAGGVPCPGCRQARYSTQHPIIPLQGGALAVLACPTHQSEVINRFRTGLRTQHHLTTSLDGV